ncbi:calmodulin-binding protein 60 D-like [Apium graveolens]|uniref:calmodulin-binding protein 60 D-like n=1 Tax=Apium graveolens TaxID=4045 RepID=UPI003D7AA636
MDLKHSTEVEILVLKGDCAGHESFNGNPEDFDNRIVGKMEGKTSVLQGTTTLKLKEGINNFVNLSFTQNSGWTKISRLCLGARAVNSFPGTTIEPGKTESFDLKDHRVTCWTRISKLFLEARTVDSFPRTTIEPAETESFDLKDHRTADTKVGPKKWEEIIDHANTSIINDEVHVYISGKT